MLHLWRDMLDEAGFWPRDLIAKMACAGMCMVMICLTAHFAPFTIEAFFAALVAGVFIVLAILIVAGIGLGVLGAIMVFMDRQAAAEAGEATLEQPGTAGPESAVPAMHGDAAPESVVPAEGGDQLQRELRCHDDP